MSRIQDVKVQAVDHSLEEPFEISLGKRTSAKNLLITVHTADGVTGYGEASPMPPVTGETQEAALATAHSASNLLLSEDCREYRKLAARVRETYPGMVSTQFAIETAILDARCRELDIPLAELFGGMATPVQTDLTIPIVSPKEARRRAADAVEAGFQELKIKTGAGLEADLERIRAVHDAAPEVALKIDANQGWTVKESLTFLTRIQSDGIELELLEQPVRSDDIRGLATITEQSQIPIAADEAVFSTTDAIRIVRQNAADIINIKLGKSGLVSASDIISIAEAANLNLMIGCMLEGAIGIHASAHFVSGTGAFNYVDLDGNQLLADDFVATNLGPKIDITGPGHGITVDIS